uniref:Uncharacterized protein n=1 Tax=Arundo donax TaxID=35708 RepID=A0A0A9HI28_ARUDO
MVALCYYAISFAVCFCELILIYLLLFSSIYLDRAELYVSFHFQGS